MVTSTSKKSWPFKVIYPQDFALIDMEAEMEVVSQTDCIESTLKEDMFYEELYESTFPLVAAFVRQMNGSFDDARDIFQDALIIYSERISERHLRISVLPERYILGIAKHLWLRKFKDDKRKVSLDDFEKKLSLPNDFYPDVAVTRILQYLEVAGTRCLDLLRSFYFENNTLKQAAAKLGYGSEHSAAVQKYKCLEKIRETIKDKSMTYEDFFE